MSETPFDLSSEEWTNLMLSVNTHRSQRRLSPAEVSLLVTRALRRGSRRELAEALNMSDSSTIAKFALISQISPELRELVSWGQSTGSVSMSVAAELARLPDPQSMAASFRAALEHRMTKSEAREVVQAYRRDRGDISTCIAAALRGRPKRERRELILGAILDAQVRDGLATLAPDDRTALLRKTLRKAFPSVRPLGCSLNLNHFSIVLSSDESTNLRAALAGASLEDILAKRLRESLTPT